VRVDDVPEGLAHLAPVRGADKAVAEDALWHLEARRKEHGVPIDAVEADYVLADDVAVARPEARQRVVGVGRVHAAHVVGQRVEPNVPIWAQVKARLSQSAS